MLDCTSSLPNNRFAWLTPLDGRNKSNGPWLLTDDDTFRVTQSEHLPSAQITVKALLDAIMSVLNIDSPAVYMQMEETWRSACGRYTVYWHRQSTDTSRLFVQQRSDYFARVELYLDDSLLVAYQEPVWPHLQRPRPTPVERLKIPTACIEALESGSGGTADARLPESSANQAFIESGDDTIAA